MSDLASQSLDNIGLLSVLSPAEREQVARQCRWKRYSAGEQIIDSQSDSRDVFFVVKGLVRVVNFSLSGREVTLDDVATGGFFGELAALDGQPRSANVMAKEETTVAVLSPEGFTRLVASHPDLALAVMRQLCRLVRQCTDRIMDLSSLGSNNRVHAELLRLARAVEPKGRSAVLRPIPNHSDIASRVSTTRETVARVLSDLARQGVVRRDRDGLAILDIPQLEDLVVNVRGA